MDLEQRLNHLESHHDWYGLAAALEEAVSAASDNALKASLHLRLGRLLNSRFVQGVRALKHFQDAFKLNPTLVEALVEARAIYWEIGKLNMVQKLLELQLKTTADTQLAASLSEQLGEVLYDQDQFEKAVPAYSRALELRGGVDATLEGIIEDLTVSDDSWQERIAMLLRAAHGATSSDVKAQTFLRAARIARRFAPEEVESILTQAYSADFRNSAIAALLENLLVEAQRTDVILQLQESIVAAASASDDKVSALLHFGTRWALRHQNPEVAGHFFNEVMRQDPSQVAVLIYLREQLAGNTDALQQELTFVDGVISSADVHQIADLCAVAGLIAWTDLGDVETAAKYFSLVSRVDSAHPVVADFVVKTGAVLEGAPVSVQATSASASVVAPSTSEVAGASGDSSVREAPAPVSEPATAVSVEPEALDVPAEPRRENAARVAELRAQVRQFEDAKKFHDVVKALVALGDELVEVDEKLEAYLRAADLYVSKFANQAEAVRVYEKVIDVDPLNPLALDYLRQMYEKRRDWEKLIALNVSQANQVESGPERSAMFKDVARMATERVKKPDVCIDLWSKVLESDPDDIEALNVLSQMYERARDFEKLATILERLSELSSDRQERINVLNKLGQIVGDRLNDDARAVEAYRALLELVPDDCRAQEQLKKRYVSLGRWDDLEFFYAESGKWDEFIRILETNEAKTQDTEQRIGMLMKIAELWMTQKGKADRAARSYEKVLQLDANNLAAAERLAPLYADANNYKGLAGVIEVKLQHVGEPSERLDLLREVGRLYEGKLHDKVAAFERFLAVFEIAPSDEEAQNDVERAAKAVARWDDLVAAYRKSVDAAVDLGDLDGANGLRLRLGRILVEELQQIDDALEQYSKVYESDPTNLQALQALESLYRQTSRWRELLDVYARKLELVEFGEDRKAVLYEIARLHEEQVGDLKAAIETYENVLAEDPADAVALAALDSLFLRTESWDQYAEILRRRIELDVDEPTLVDLKFRLAGVLLSQPEGEADALTNYRGLCTSIRSTRARATLSKACFLARRCEPKRLGFSRLSTRAARNGTS
ncbi:MAG: tetratricopeptide repeat protein [Polyangiaceae bacterium]